MKLLTIFLCLFLCSCSQFPVFSGDPVRVLFIGNSLTYTGNLPAVFVELAATNKKRIITSMIANGGATLSDHLRNDKLKQALTDEHFDNIVLQERGGDFICAFGPESCINARIATTELTKLSSNNGANVLLLGTYQPNPGVSVELVKAERAAGKNAGIAVISVSNHFQMATKVAPSGKWLHKDKAHPGNALVLLKAVLLYHQIFGEFPNPVGFRVNAPIFLPSARFSHGINQSQDGLDVETPVGYTYSSEDVLMILDIIKRANVD
jgi:hypothetical protein